MRHGDEEDGPQKCTMHRPQTAYDHHQQQVHRLQDAELIGADELHFVGIEGPTHTRQCSRQHERQGFVSGQVNAHALR